jgi:hypothetical protein
MTNKSPLKPLLFRHDEPELVLVESKPFVDFDRWMDEQLELLVERWAHTAAPNAARADLVRERFGRAH